MRTSVRHPFITAAVWAIYAASASANPTGATVVNGQVTMNPAGNLLSITNSPNSIINWQSFSIGANEITRFLQQSGNSAVLNRVIGAGGTINPSVILGALQSNGRVFLINPSGIVFGGGSQIDVAGLVASSLNLSNADFLAGRLRFTEVPGAGGVVNQGAINAAAGGQVYLVGPSVTNSGIINTPQGEVILAAGNSVELVNPGTPGLRVEISAPENEALNLGSIVASSGRIGIYAGLIKSSGTLNADRAVTGPAGEILLVAKSVILEGKSTAVDGAITITGDAINVASGANIQTGPVIVPNLAPIQLIGGSAPGGNVTLVSGTGQNTGIPSGLTLDVTNLTAGQGTISVGGATGPIAINTAGSPGTGTLTIAAGTNSAPGTVTVNNVTTTLAVNPGTGTPAIAAGAGSTPAAVTANSGPSTVAVNRGTGTLAITAGAGSAPAAVTANSGSIPSALLSSAAPSSLLPMINLLALPAVQVVVRGTSQVTGGMSTISQVNDFARRPGGVVPGLLMPPRGTLVFE